MNNLRCPRKFQILLHLKREGSVTYQEVSEAIGIKEKTASSLLSKYHKQNLVRTEGGWWVITERGKERLSWMRKQGYSLKKAKNSFL